MQVIDVEVRSLSDRKKDPVGAFEMVCKGVESGYVLESSHPYASQDIDQCVEVSAGNIIAAEAGSQC